MGRRVGKERHCRNVPLLLRRRMDFGTRGVPVIPMFEVMANQFPELDQGQAFIPFRVAVSERFQESARKHGVTPVFIDLGRRVVG